MVRLWRVACLFAGVGLGLCVGSQVSAQSASQQGRALFLGTANCVQCHKTPTETGIKSVSNIGPALEAIKQKYPTIADRARLRERIWDASKAKPDTIMPPYGKHRILTEAEIDLIVVYLETL